MAPSLPPALAKAYAAYQSGDLAGAERAATLALRVMPGNTDVHYLLGGVLLRLGKPEQAEFHLRRACEGKPNDLERQLHFVRTLLVLHKMTEAKAAAHDLTTRFPASAAAFLAASEVAQIAKDDDAAYAALTHALELNPADANAMNRLASAKNLRGDHAAARAMFDASLQLDRVNPQLAAPAAFAANAWSDITALELFERHTEITRRIAMVPPLKLPPRSNTRDPNRKLRVTYMTPDAREHSCAHFIRAIFEHHDRGAGGFDVGLYCNVKHSADATTTWLQSRCDRYVELTGMSEQQAAERIVADGTDILVDLAGHTAGTGVWLLRSRLAPVQMTYLGYPNTCAMPQADYRIVDAVTDPDGAEALATEKLLRLDPCFLCYTPPTNAPPAARSRDENQPPPFTFGSFNALHKHSPQTLDLFAAVLKAVPHARLLVKNKSLGITEGGGAADRFAAALVSRGIARERFDLLAFLPEVRDHLAAYHRVDAALDTTPYNGTTTTCEALFMGVPVVTLRGDRHAARVSASLLSSADDTGTLRRLIAATPSEYTSIAASLADAASPLARALADRDATRARLLASSLCDGQRFTRTLESAYRHAWRSWCASSIRT